MIAAPVQGDVDGIPRDRITPGYRRWAGKRYCSFGPQGAGWIDPHGADNGWNSGQYGGQEQADQRGCQNGQLSGLHVKQQSFEEALGGESGRPAQGPRRLLRRRTLGQLPSRPHGRRGRRAPCGFRFHGCVGGRSNSARRIIRWRRAAAPSLRKRQRWRPAGVRGCSTDQPVAAAGWWW